MHVLGSTSRLGIATAALVAAVVVFLLATLPPRPQAVRWTGDPDLARRTVAGAYHIHTTVSDGTKDKRGVAAAAARAGLRFIILTDHGDGTREPARPAYIDGVLCLEGTEISTQGGHYVALGLGATPYPLGGEPSAVVDDVHRFGGFGIAAHVDSPKPALAWTDWGAPVDGVEWLNADNEWRNERRARLARVMFDYLVRPGPALASMFDRPVDALKRWDGLTSRRPVIGIAGHDAHGGMGRRREDGGGIPGIPTYEASFRSFSVRAILDAPFAGDAGSDGLRLLDAIANGRIFTAIDSVAAPAVLDFRGTSFGREGTMGSVLRAGNATVSVRAAMPEGAQIVVIRNGSEMPAPFGDLDLGATTGAVRVEIRVPGAPGEPPVPWVVSNPLYFLPPRPTPATVGAGEKFTPTHDLTWRIEKDRESTASVAVTAETATASFQLAAGERASQYAALVSDLGGQARTFHSIAFDARATRRMRVSVQLRYPTGRWVHSVYVDAIPRRITVPAGDLLPADRQTGPMPDTAGAGSLLFVVDLTNMLPGGSGAFSIADVAFGRGGR